MKNLAAFILTAVALAGCATNQPSVPQLYAGPRATLKDTVRVHGGSKADFFHVSHVDDKQIENNRIKTRSANRGRGMQLVPIHVQREIAARPTKLTIVARTEYAAPILALTGTVYQVKGEVEFTPEPGKSYVVRGELGESYSAVWIEDERTAVVVGKKIEVQGSAKLGAFEK